MRRSLRGAQKEEAGPSGQMTHTLPEPALQEPGGSSRVGVSFAAPPSIAQPLVSTAQASVPTRRPQVLIPLAAPPTPASSAFTLHHVPEDQIGAGKEAMIQAGLMMQRLKEVYDANKSAYDASSALQANVRVSAIVS